MDAATTVDAPTRPPRLGQSAHGLTTAPTGLRAIVNGEQGLGQEGIDSKAFEAAEEPLTAAEGGDVGAVDPRAGAAIAAGQVSGSQSRSGLPAGIDVDGRQIYRRAVLSSGVYLSLLYVCIMWIQAPMLPVEIY